MLRSRELDDVLPNSLAPQLVCLRGVSMQLYTIRASGFTASVDAFAQDGEQLWFISMLGSQQSVRALWARLVKGETAYVSEGDFGGGSPCWLAREAWGTWRFHGAR